MQDRLGGRGDDAEVQSARAYTDTQHLTTGNASPPERAAEPRVIPAELEDGCPNRASVYWQHPTLQTFIWQSAHGWLYGWRGGWQRGSVRRCLTLLHLISLELLPVAAGSSGVGRATERPARAAVHPTDA